MYITSVKIFEVSGTWDGPAYPPGDRQAQQLDAYPDLERGGGNRPGAKPGSVTESYLEIETDESISGIFGPIDADQVHVITTHLGPLLIGKDPLATEARYDQMIRLHRHGRSGLFMTGVSAVDCALWDLKGKAFDVPVYRLLGGPVRPRVPAYASMLGYSIRPADAAEVASDFKTQGFGAQKWFFRYGPADGGAGRVKNIAMARAVREAVGDEYTLMFDAFMGWDLPYAMAMARDLHDVRPFWLEEPLPPERIGSFRELRSAGVPLATGEHVYTRWQVKQLLEPRAVDVIQADPDWTGGITELTKICALCSAYDTPVVAHGHSLLAALHVAGSQSPAAVPMVEYLIRHQQRKQFFHDPTYRPVEGEIELPTLPGLGIALDESKIESRREVGGA